MPERNDHRNVPDRSSSVPVHAIRIHRWIAAGVAALALTAALAIAGTGSRRVRFRQRRELELGAVQHGQRRRPLRRV
jgi:hypothetical protein